MCTLDKTKNVWTFWVADIYIPHLQKFDGQKPCDHQVEVVIEPKCPVPTALPVHVVFAGKDGRTYVSAVGTVEISFEDLALPLPVSMSVY